LRVDVHIHTAYSDGAGSIEDVVRAAEFKGLDGLAITDHGTLNGYFEAKSYSSRIIVLPGYEVNTDAGHILVLGLERLPPRLEETVPYEDLIKWVKFNGGLSILAHPAIMKPKLDRWISCKPDAVEVLNASYPLRHILVSRGLSLSLKLDVPGVGGSDAHTPINVGDAYTIVEVDGDPCGESIIKSIREGKANYAGKLSPLNTRLRMGAAYILSKITLNVHVKT
jgi:predicted metal-dependent phosphoesterase TrpH